MKDNNNGDVRKAIVPLNLVAQEAGTAILGITHPNKSATDAANKVMGSKAWRSVPRSVILYGRDPDDIQGETRIAAVSKTNYATKTAVKVRVESVTVEGINGTQPCASIVGKSDYGDSDVLLANASTSRGGENGLGKREQAQKLLYQMLEDGGGEIDASVSFQAAAAEGISGRTMKRAREDIGASGGRVWTLLPEDSLPVT
jgi:hypothetical protein